MPEFVTYQGQRVTPWMKYQLERLDADLRKKFGVRLVARSAIRTKEEQTKIFLDRYVTAGNINGRKVYDTRVWNGTRYYRISPAGTVAVPGTSNHEIQGDRAAVDIADSGSDAGITVRGSKRGQWIRQNAGNYGLVASGDGFGEGWHFDMPGINRAVPGSTASTGAKVSQVTKDRQAWLNQSRKAGLAVDGVEGPKTKAAYKAYQNFLRAHYGYRGALDGIWGPGTQAAHQKYWNALHKPATPPAPAPRKGNPFGIPSAAGLQKVAKLYGYTGKIDDIWGNGSDDGFSAFLKKNYGYRGGRGMTAQKWAAIARWLRAKYGYVGNDQPGPVMRAALKRANDKNYKEL
jgi:peptidoglycan hydrolase-like protein with peptidoglycan-binding domain